MDKPVALDPHFHGGDGWHCGVAMSASITLDMLRAASSAEFPVIDLGPYLRGDAGALGRVAAELREALEHIGFLIVVNHGVSAALTDGIVAEARRFHTLPLDE